MKILFLSIVCGLAQECADFEQGVQCGRSCQATEASCSAACETPECEWGCLSELDKCIAGCPCGTECPDGCADCPTGGQYCQCGEPNENPDYLFCQRAVEAQYNRCVYNCAIGDTICFADCNRAYSDDHSKCPCMENCPNGCPCDDVSLEYQCPDGHKFNTVAIMHKKDLAILTHPSGRTEPMDLTYGEGVNPHYYGGPSVVFRNQMYMWNYNRDVYNLVNCNFVKIGVVEFEPYRAVVAKGQIILVENRVGGKNGQATYKTSDPIGTHTQLASTAFPHQGAPIAAGTGNIIVFYSTVLNLC